MLLIGAFAAMLNYAGATNCVCDSNGVCNLADDCGTFKYSYRYILDILISDCTNP